MRLADTPCAAYFPEKGRQARYRESVYTGYRYYDAAGAEVALSLIHILVTYTFTNNAEKAVPFFTAVSAKAFQDVYKRQKVRRATKPSRRAKEARLADKRRRAETKARRRPVDGE